MDKFSAAYSPPRLNHEKTVNRNMPVTHKEIKSVIKTL